MSPPELRRYRAERLLHREFQALRERVLGRVGARLRTSGVPAEAIDLEVSYALAWQGLYAAVLEGQEIANPAGWLVTVTFRRAIDEYRGHALEQPRDRGEGPDEDWPPAVERDLAQELDDRLRLRHVFEALRGRLSVRERQAAALCYLQGLSRAEAAARIGISERSMTKLMEGRGPGRPGVAGKVGALLATIRADGWCEEQGSLMRGLAFGVLDRQGDRYRLAVAHTRECPACRAYVSCLRGLAAILPPVFLPLGPGAIVGLGGGAVGGLGASGGLAGAGTAAGAGPGAAGTGTVAGAGAGAAGTATAAGAGAGAAGAGAAGAGAGAGGGWVFAGGSAAVKLAAGCLVALGVGAGCVTIVSHSSGHAAGGHRSHSRPRARIAGGDPAPLAAAAAGPIAASDPLLMGKDRSKAGRSGKAGGLSGKTVGGDRSRAGTPAVARARSASVTPAALEFGPERSASSSGSAATTPSPATATTRSAAPSAPTGDSGSPGSAGAPGSGALAAGREFGIR